MCRYAGYYYCSNKLIAFLVVEFPMIWLFSILRKVLAGSLAILGGGLASTALILYCYCSVFVWQISDLKLIVIYFGLVFGGILIFWFGCYLSSDAEKIESDLLASLTRNSSDTTLSETSKNQKSYWTLFLWTGAIAWNVVAISQGHLGFLNVLVAVLVGTQVALFWHELGHLIAGFVLGMRPSAFVVGSGPVLWEGCVWGVDVRLSLFPTSGWVQGGTWRKSGYRWRRALFIMAGPLADLIFVFALGAGITTVVANGGIATSDNFLFQAAVILLFWEGRLIFSSIIPQEINVQGRRLFTDGYTVSSAWTYSDRSIAILCGYSILADFQKHQNLEKGRDQLGLIKKDVEKFPDCTQLLLVQASLQNSLGETDLSPIFRKLLVRPDLDESNREGVLYLMQGIMAKNWTVDAISQETAIWLAANVYPIGRAKMLDSLACLPIFNRRPDLLPCAVEWVKEAMALHPSAITQLGTLGSLYIEMERWEEGAELLNEVLEKTMQDHDRAICHFYLGLYFKHQGKNKEAEEHFQRSRSFQPSEWLRKRLDGPEVGRVRPE